MSLELKNLVFEGGGVKGIAYAGALKVLDDAKILKDIKHVAGTSAGSIVAALIALGYDSPSITKLIRTTNFKSFEDRRCIFRILTSYGLYKGQAFLKWMRARVKDQLGKENANFQEVYNKTQIDLRVFSTDLNEKNIKEFSVKNTPTVPVAEAVRASMSIPLFFKAWQFPAGVPDNHIYVDGGTVFNYPISTFDSGAEPNEHTLGFHLDNLSGIDPPNNLGDYELVHYIRDLFSTLLEAQVIDFENDPDNLARTVRIDDHGISATDFNLSEKQKQLLYDSGVKATTEYLNKHGITVPIR